VEVSEHKEEELPKVSDQDSKKKPSEEVVSGADEEDENEDEEDLDNDDLDESDY